MKEFNLKEQVSKCSNSLTLPLIQTIESNRGKIFSLPMNKHINRLHDETKRKSVTSSNKIEGITIASNRENDILIKNMKPESKEEYLIFGYNKALENVLQVYKYQSLNESYILDLHYLMYESITPEFGGKYKTEQNYINEFNKKGEFTRTVFIPSKPKDVEQLMGNLIFQYNECLKDPTCNKLILIFTFILDFLCIHPFSDGNGRISRLLSSFLLLKNGYDLDLYYPLSYLILHESDRYYSSLEKSSNGWNENNNDYMPFVHFMLEMVSKGYEKLFYIMEINKSKLKSDDIVLKIVNDSKFPMTKQDIEEIAFSLSRTTIEKSLSILTKSKKIQMLQKGKYAKYYKI